MGDNNSNTVNGHEPHWLQKVSCNREVNSQINIFCSAYLFTHFLQKLLMFCSQPNHRFLHRRHIHRAGVYGHTTLQRCCFIKEGRVTQACIQMHQLLKGFSVFLQVKPGSYQRTRTQNSIIAQFFHEQTRTGDRNVIHRKLFNFHCISPSENSQW